MAIWKEVASDSAFNTAIAAAATEKFQSTDSRVQNFNRLEISNRDAVDIQIQLNGQTTKGRIFEIPAGSMFTIEPDEGIWFAWVVQQNIDAATAETANKILFRWANCVKIGG